MLAVTYPWASASSFVTTAGDATPLWEDVTDPTCSGDTRPWASAPSYLSSQSVADSRCNPHATPRSPTLVVLPPVASSSVAPLSSASFRSATAACRSLALAASPASRRSSALLAAYCGPSSLSSSPLTSRAGELRTRTGFLWFDQLQAA